MQPREHETSRSRAESSEVLRCPRCGVFGWAGRWSWEAPPGADVFAMLCPACRRVQDRYPAGTIRLRGELGELRDELLALLRNLEEQEQAEHPLERLMEIVDIEDGLEVTTTGIHMARCIAAALERRFHGHADIRYPEEQGLVYVDWSP